MNLPPDVHDELDWLSRVFLYDPVPHGDASLPEELMMLAAAIERRRVVHARLSAADVTKTVYPLALVDNAGTWLLIADVAGRRSAFDVAGLHDVATTGRRFNRPDDFDLRAFWEQWRSEERALGES